MLPPIPPRSAALLLFWLGFVLRGSAAELAAGSTQSGLLLLANGSILEGKVSLSDEYYKVVLPHGELQIRKEQVDCFCSDLQEVYQKLHSRRIDNSLASYLELARWCIQHDLFAEADSELNDAETFAPRSSLVTQVRAQLDQSRSLAESVITSKILMHQVVQASYAEATATAPRDSSAPELPPWAKSEFVKRVQPLLLHSCATGGCHTASQASGWILNRGAVDGVGNPDLIEQNLSSVLDYVDRENTQQSEILKRGLNPHGPELRPSEMLRPRQIAILEAWLEQLAFEQQSGGEPVAQTSASDNNRLDNSGSANTPSSQTASSEKDPFDPAAFNQRYHGDKREQITPLPDIPPDSGEELPNSPQESSP